MNKVILKIDGMSCSACSNALEKYLNKQTGITATVNLVMAQALIEYDDNYSVEDLNRFIEEAGYQSLGIYNEKKDEERIQGKNCLIIFAFLVLILMYISMSPMLEINVISSLNMHTNPIGYGIILLILTFPFLIYGFDIIKNGIKHLIHKTPNMDTLVMIGVLSSFLYSIFNLILVIKGNKNSIHNLYFESSATVIYFIKLGRYIDKKSKTKTKQAIKDLVQITPQFALLKTNDKEIEVTIDEVKKGDILICKPGMQIAVDGVITSGEAHLDDSFITGETLHDKKKISDQVVAGSIVLDGIIEYKAERIGKNSTISEIVRLVVEATNTKAPIGILADKVSGYFVPTIIIISILTLFISLIIGRGINDSLISFVTVLVVACPCALGLATPLAIITSEGNSARKGILIKTSKTLENAHKVDTIIFDKTGTLTYGKLKISEVNNYSNYSNKELLIKVASLENNSVHPISNAFKTYIKENNCQLYNTEKFSNLNGIGITGVVNGNKIYVGSSKVLSKLEIYNKYEKEEMTLAKKGNSILYVVENKKIIALIGVRDTVRINAKKTIDKLKKLNKKIVMLSGDNNITASIIAKELEIKEVVANCLPKDKELYLEKINNNNHLVMMVGDGINDAPSLARADIGVSVNGGTDIAANSSDVILMDDNLEKIVDLITISKRTIHIIKQNLFWAFFYNLCMIPIAIGILEPIGIKISPMIASIAMTISSLTVVCNSLRLRN